MSNILFAVFVKSFLFFSVNFSTNFSLTELFFLLTKNGCCCCCWHIVVVVVVDLLLLLTCCCCCCCRASARGVPGVLKLGAEAWC